MIIEIKPEAVEVTISTRDMHTLEDHNFWIGRGRPCPYCLAGSEPVPKDKLLMGLK